MTTIRDLFLDAPSSQLSPLLKPLIRQWGDEPTSLQILEVLDHCVNGGSGSQFVVATLQAMYDNALKAEGIEHNDNVPKATWRAEYDGA